MATLVHVTTVPDALIFLRGQTAFMKQRGYDIVVISSPGAGLDAFAEREGVRAIGVPMTRRMTPISDLVALTRLVGHLWRLRPDVVHSHTPKGGLLGVTAAFIAGVPVRIYHLRGLPLVTATGLSRATLRVTERVACGLATSVLAVGHSLRRLAVAEGLAPASKIRVLGRGSGNGVDARGRFDPERVPVDARHRVRAALGVPPEAVLVVFVGRLVRDKGVVELADAWRRVREAVPHAHLILAGERESRDSVPAAVLERLDGDPSVSMLGFVEDTPPLYAAADVVVLPTHREGFPNVPLEAAAMGRPVVATRVVGCVDAVLDGVTGALVPAGDAAALADALIAYARDPGRSERHGRAARRRALLEFEPSRLWAELDAFYRDALGAPEPPPRTTEAHAAS